MLFTYGHQQQVGVGTIVSRAVRCDGAGWKRKTTAKRGVGVGLRQVAKTIWEMMDRLHAERRRCISRSPAPVRRGALIEVGTGNWELALARLHWARQTTGIFRHAISRRHWPTEGNGYIRHGDAAQESQWESGFARRLGRGLVLYRYFGT
ncbi:predicted protein [Pyrenophora tritici-repentis Pt-1C-BFP]|uniref:Uncharacterized protein n=1 Tax=Pyrenophora tritici-repentis (strain Pt-1C-BFP) TaxID=426418 RepID=B2WIK2_PYRTR|nr:uncharacterized protein PTRG_09811 [Pyrenophora tritici-repentis Pt-1C-BFP]EDU42862.1 predicted protein [Pyrenophora tritici-repentis Pt-1C-BFP]